MMKTADIQKSTTEKGNSRKNSNEREKKRLDNINLKSNQRKYEDEEDCKDKNDGIAEMIKETFTICSFQNDISYFVKIRVDRIGYYKNISKSIGIEHTNLLNPENNIIEEQKKIVSVFNLQERYIKLKLSLSPRLKELLTYMEEIKEEPPAKYICYEMDISRHRLKSLLTEIFEQIDEIYKIYLEIS
ncbi:hypothetical protein QJL30_10515 [Clostridioides difficile]|nr:hypothetical protein [Clostridioides difficile]MDI3004374.1 hypothetical protein [Clostridioides difficile]